MQVKEKYLNAEAVFQNDRVVRKVTRYRFVSVTNQSLELQQTEHV
jgi:hypothetical protein